MPDREDDLTEPGPTPHSVSSSSIHGRFLPGAQLGRRFRIVSLIGRGGMGEVYRADDLELGQTVALKFLPENLAKDAAALARLRHEVRVAREVSHPNVCRVYDIGQEEGQTFLAMEFVDGEDLSALLRRVGRFPPERGLDLARQLCAGLAAAHEQGIVHRDLKPANVIVDGRGRVRILDFGLAGFREELGGARETAGTPSYMAPEQLRGEGATVRSDVYALGLILYEIFIGRRAFAGKSLPEIQAAIAAGPPGLRDRVAEIDAATERAVKRCLESDPARRPTSAAAVAAAMPGGDPLAAALAAGETPSPEMVAAAGGEGILRPAVAGTLALLTLAGILAVAALNNEVALFRLVGSLKPPVVLQDRGREILTSLDRESSLRDQGYSISRDHPLVESIAARDHSVSRWDRMRDATPGVLGFWLRGHESSLVPNNFERQIRWNDPPFDREDMVRLVLDAGTGDLRRLEIVGSSRAPAQRNEPVAQATWERLFGFAGLDPARFRPCPPVWLPALPTVERRAWLGTFDSADGEGRVRVEAGGQRGRPVYFRLVYPHSSLWVAETDAARPATPTPPSLARVFDAFWLLISLAAIFGPWLMARRNLRRGSADRRGALVFGAAIGLMAGLSLGLRIHLSSHLADLPTIVFVPLMAGIFVGAWIALLHLALEPAVRRLAPNCLASFGRLLQGRVRDPLVGRSILLGGLVGTIVAVLRQLERVAPTWFGQPMTEPRDFMTDPLDGPLEPLAGFFDPQFLMYILIPGYLITLLFLVLKRRRLTLVVSLVLLFVTFLGVNDVLTGVGLTTAIGMTVMLGWLVIYGATLFTGGLLSILVAQFFYWRLMNAPLTLDTTAWYFPAGMLVALALAMIALYGAHTAQRRSRPTSPDPNRLS